MGRLRSIAVFAAVLLTLLLSALLFSIWVGFTALYGDDGDFAQYDVANEIRRSLAVDEAGRPRVVRSDRLDGYQRAFPRLWYLVSNPHGSVAYGPVPERVLAGRGVAERPAVRSAFTVRDGDIHLDHSAHPDANGTQIEIGGAAYAGADVVLSFFKQPDDAARFIPAVSITILLTTVLIVPALIVRPVKRVAAAAAEIGAMDGARLPLDRQPWELRPLVSAFNLALDRIDVAVAEQRRFLSNAAHELRTPLTRLRTRLERVDDAALKGDLVAELQGLSGTVTMLLQLARLTSEPAEMSRLDLVAAARKAAATEAPAAVAAGVDIAFQGADAPIMISGSDQAIAVGLSNIIRNAIHHGGAGRRVLIKAMAPACVSVIDFGSGLDGTLGDRSPLEPYARGKKDADGTGLGLAIVAQIAALHRAGLAIEDTPGGGTTVTMTFPPA